MTKHRNSEPESQLISLRHHHSFGPICRKSHKRNASEIAPFREFWLQKDGSSVVVQSMDFANQSAGNLKIMVARR